MAIDAAEPNSTPRTSRARTQRSNPPQSPRTTRRPKSDPPTTATTSASSSASASQPSTSTASSSTYKFSTGTTSVSSRNSLQSFRQSLPESLHIYDFSEICSATNNFLAKRFATSSSTPSWRCTLRTKEVIVFQRKFRRKIESSQLRERLSIICRSHHMSIIKLLGASISGEHIYLVYDFVTGANLADCLRNSRNPNFTVFSSWISRVQIATDLAHGLDYIHNNTGLNMSLVHNHIKSSSVIVTEPSFNAKICHFGAAQLCGEVDENEGLVRSSSPPHFEGVVNEITEEKEPASKSKELTRSSSLRLQFEGVNGYMSPEYQATGVAAQPSDVYAFGVVMLELLSGEEPLKYRFDKKKGDFARTSIIETASAAIYGGYSEDSPEGGSSGGGVEGRLRRWIDRRLKDSFPVDVAEELTRIALECVEVDPGKRPNMSRVAGKISKLYLKSRIWSDNMKIPTNISVSLAPR